ncbi:MAG: voltage-gated potassium channel [Gemmataceae bacterium]|nr:voltage-gated potassium channel [Gemmataceae bacterium]
MAARRPWLERLVQLLIVYSIATLFLELEIDSHSPSSGFFLWSERAVAAAFTVEYLLRWIASRSWRYPLRPMAVIDLLAVAPFYVGFFVDPAALRLVRLLRVVRVLKLDRQGAAAVSLYRAYSRIRHEIQLTAIAGLVVGLGGTAAVFELERGAQPEAFGRISDSAWYILATVTTVGYGDRVPVTPGGRIVGGMVMLSGLVLFGTFVSLVGSAFVEEIRRTRIAAESKGGLPPDLMSGKRPGSIRKRSSRRSRRGRSHPGRRWPTGKRSAFWHSHAGRFSESGSRGPRHQAGSYSRVAGGRILPHRFRRLHPTHAPPYSPLRTFPSRSPKPARALPPAVVPAGRGRGKGTAAEFTPPP